MLNEPESERFAAAIAMAPIRLISTLNWLEASMVAKSRFGDIGRSDISAALQDLGINILPFDSEQAKEALAAWERFGKRRHSARLNLGDCCAYAAAIVTGEPLLFKGGDFSLTDVSCAEW